MTHFKLYNFRFKLRREVFVENVNNNRQAIISLERLMLESFCTQAGHIKY